MKTRLSPLLAALPLLSLLTACGSAAAPMGPSAPSMAAMPAPAVLQQSLFTKDSSGALGENDLQHVLSTPIDLQFPARVGVVPLAQAFDPRGPVSIGTRSVAARDLATALIGGPHYSHVSDVSTDLPNTGGIEGLRLIAARYRLRYLLLYSERFEDSTHLNGWAWLYPTVLGMFVAPGVTVESSGLVQADLLDVRTGTILFSVVEPMQVHEKEWMIGAGRSHRELQGEAAAKAAKRLAHRVTEQTEALVAYAERMGSPDSAHARLRIIPAPVAVDAPVAARPATATATIAAQ
jgi:rhombotail lipoprotein